MKWPEDTYIAALGVSLPAPTRLADAVADGLVSAQRARDLDYESICIDEDTAPPVRAVRAARSALERAGLDGRDLGLLLHCSTWFQGLDVWPVGSYVGAQLGSNAPAFDVQQRCNGSLGSIEFAASALHGGTSAKPVLITTADRFAGPAVDRWHLQDRSFYGDGGTALVLSRAGGVARVLATSTMADNTLEAITRGDAPFETSSPAHKEPVDLVRRAGEYYARNDMTRAQARLVRVITRTAIHATKDAGTTISGVTRVISAAQGKFQGEHRFHTLIGVEEDRLAWEFGGTTGHVGAGDWFAGLDHLLRTRAVGPGDKVLLVGGGAGFTCTSVVVEILEQPDWAPTPDPTHDSTPAHGLVEH